MCVCAQSSHAIIESLSILKSNYHLSIKYIYVYIYFYIYILLLVVPSPTEGIVGEVMCVLGWGEWIDCGD